MARMLQALRRLWGSSPPPSPKTPVSSPSLPSQSVGPRRFPSIDTNFTYLREGDRAVIDGKVPTLTRPLRKGGRTDGRRGGRLEHDEIIGRRVRDQIPSHKGPDYRLYHPTLEEYVALTPRMVTPIYSADANLIVSLLDIHVAPSSDPEQPPLEILESGTGHGSLTLHLARAIQGANSVPPPFPTTSQVKDLVPSRSPSSASATASSASSPTPPPSQTTPETTPTIEQPPTDTITTQTTWDAWRAQRKAVIHTVDITHKTARHAETLVRGFRRGIYAGNVDFYSGPVETWVAAQKQERSRSSGHSTATTSDIDGQTAAVDPFLSYAILDMPSSHLRIPHVTSILKRDGLLAVFTPSVTQIGDCLELIRRERLPLVQEKVVELGNGISSGRLWDVRFAVRKNKDTLAESGSGGSSGSASGVEVVEEQQREEEAVEPVEEVAEVAEETASSPTSAPSSVAAAEGEEEEEVDRVLVCRPKVGPRIVGGGFVGIWRRIEDANVKDRVNVDA
ncbi:tRNA (adenine-N(1)-)-methyltransferase [Aspergillus saccharolyticus JOP 1030-1]|uniref:tRNA (adenine(58)-N(1))-methyltransferase catalytic subunit TRM61 n=1 Tax=Aspergillus saccharolyticus JOP 1030-1 TaxID=1450539 RepID=A0A319AJB3_9EURO|nr:hypothetical protein BP01DRAFT_390401 [Aspergillus saccharolyticus JOP 1030-1]PYH46722.1 hypothetical protein BP01DRAFT_390401 [Aspergillus saccharolyticus JOP 1030-1]